MGMLQVDVHPSEVGLDADRLRRVADFAGASVAGDQHVGAHHVTVLHERPGEVGHALQAVGIQAHLGGMDVDRQTSHGG